MGKNFLTNQDLPDPSAAAKHELDVPGNPPADGAKAEAGADVQARAEPTPGDDRAKYNDMNKEYLDLVVKADEDRGKIQASAARRIALERNAKAIGAPFDPDRDAPLYKGDQELARKLHAMHYEIADVEKKLGINQPTSAPTPPVSGSPNLRGY